MSKKNFDITKINFSDFTQLDPLLNNQTKIYREIELPIKIKFIKKNKKILFSDKNSENLKIRIMDEFITNFEKITKIEIKSENDLFFFYCHIVDENIFLDIKKNLELNCEFENYIEFLVKIFDDIEKKFQNLKKKNF